MGEDGQGLPEGGTSVTDEGGQRFDCFDVMCVDVKAGLGDEGDVGEVAGEVASEGFNEDVGCSGARTMCISFY